MHQALNPAGFRGHVRIEVVHQMSADHLLLGGDRLAVAIGETGVQRGDQILRHRRLPVQPFRIRQGLAADQRCMQAAQLGQREGRIRDRRATDLITHLRRCGIVEQQGEEAGLGLVGGVIAARDRAAGLPRESRGHLGVEPHLAFVESERMPGPPAHRVGGGNFEHHRRRTLPTVCVAQRDPVALTHLPGADALHGEVADLACADGRR